MHHASSIMHCRQEYEIWYVDCSHEYKMKQGVMVGGRGPLVEYDLRWKTTSVGRRPLVEDNLWWKTTFGGRRPSVEDKFWWKTILGCCLVRFAAFFLFRYLFPPKMLLFIYPIYIPEIPIFTQKIPYFLYILSYKMVIYNG